MFAETRSKGHIKASYVPTSRVSTKAVQTGCEVHKLLAFDPLGV